MKTPELSTKEKIKMFKDLSLQEIEELHCQFHETSCFSPDEKVLIVQKIDAVINKLIKDVVLSLLPSDEEIKQPLYPNPVSKNQLFVSIGYIRGKQDLKQQILNKLKC